MKKIIFNTDSLIMGGAEKLAIQYVKELCKDYEVLLLINEDNGCDGNILEKDIPKNVKYKFVVEKSIMDNINKYRILKKEHKGNLFYKILYNFYLKKRRKSYKNNITQILKKEKYDVLIDFYCKVPFGCIDNRTISWLHLSLKNLKEKTKLEYEKKFSLVKKVIVINDDMKKEYEKIFPKLLNKVERIYNFFDIDMIKEMSLEEDLLTEQEKKLIEDKYMVACCRLDRQKDLETLINAFHNLKINKRIKEKLYIIGDGDKRKELENLSKNLGLEEEIIFLGTKKNPYIWMKNAQLFVHSSHREGFGMVIVEAMIVNGLVISSDCPVGPREILENGKAGILVKPQDITEMENTIFNMLSDKNIQKEKKNYCSIRIKDFSVQSNYSKLIHVIEE